MPHVGHGEHDARVDLRHRRTQAVAHRQGAGRIPGTVHGLREDRKGLRARRLDHHVEGLRDGDPELVDGDRPNGQSVSGHHGHLQPGNPHVEVGHRRAVDESQPHLLTGREQTRPVGRRRTPVHQVGVGVARDVGQIGRAHAHLTPHPSFRQRGAQTLPAHVLQERAHRALTEVVVVGLLLELAKHAIGALVGPVGEHHHVLAVVVERLRFAGVDDQRTIHAELLLKARMAVIPVGAALLDREAVVVGRARLDAGEAEPGHAVHVGRQDDAVPVNRGVLVECVGHAQPHRVAFAPAQQRPRHRSVDGQGRAVPAGDVDLGLADAQAEVGARQHRRVLPLLGVRACHARHHAEAGGGAPDGEPFHERAAGGTIENGLSVALRTHGRAPVSITNEETGMERGARDARRRAGSDPQRERCGDRRRGWHWRAGRRYSDGCPRRQEPRAPRGERR